MLCDEVGTVREFTYLCDCVTAGEGCEDCVTARKRCGWVMFSFIGKLLYGKRLLLKLKGVV